MPNDSVMPPMVNRFLSDSFIKKLENISDESGIARRLLSLKNSSLDENYIRNVTMKKDGMISYLPKGKQPELSPDGQEWTTKNRMQIKPGRFIKTWSQDWSYNFYDAEVEKFVNLIIAENNGTNFPDFKIVSGPDICKYYHESSYSTENTGTLASSCMRYTGSLPSLTFYSLNPHRIQLICLFSKQYPDKIRGRALLWLTTLGYFMDRVYCIDSDVNLFKKFAKRNGYMYKEQQDRQPGNIITPESGEILSNKLIVTDLTFKTSKIPYLDTLFDVYKDIGILSGGTLQGQLHRTGRMQSTSSSFSDVKTIKSNYHNMMIPIEGSMTGYFDYKSSIKGSMDYFFNNELFYDDNLRTYYHISNMVVSVNGKFYVCDNPNLINLTGGPLKTCCLFGEDETCFFDGKVYFRKFHLWEDYNVMDTDDKLIQVRILESNKEKFLRQYNLSPVMEDVGSTNVEVIRIDKPFKDFFPGKPSKKKVDTMVPGNEIMENDNSNDGIPF